MKNLRIVLFILAIGAAAVTHGKTPCFQPPVENLLSDVFTVALLGTSEIAVPEDGKILRNLLLNLGLSGPDSQAFLFPHEALTARAWSGKRVSPKVSLFADADEVTGLFDSEGEITRRYKMKSAGLVLVVLSSHGGRDGSTVWAGETLDSRQTASICNSILSWNETVRLLVVSDKCFAHRDVKEILKSVKDTQRVCVISAALTHKEANVETNLARYLDDPGLAGRIFDVDNPDSLVSNLRCVIGDRRQMGRGLLLFVGALCSDPGATRSLSADTLYHRMEQAAKRLAEENDEESQEIMLDGGPKDRSSMERNFALAPLFNVIAIQKNTRFEIKRIFNQKETNASLDRLSLGLRDAIDASLSPEQRQRTRIYTGDEKKIPQPDQRYEVAYREGNYFLISRRPDGSVLGKIMGTPESLLAQMGPFVGKTLADGMGTAVAALQPTPEPFPEETEVEEHLAAHPRPKRTPTPSPDSEEASEETAAPVAAQPTPRTSQAVTVAAVDTEDSSGTISPRKRPTLFGLGASYLSPLNQVYANTLGPVPIVVSIFLDVPVPLVDFADDISLDLGLRVGASFYNRDVASPNVKAVEEVAGYGALLLQTNLSIISLYAGGGWQFEKIVAKPISTGHEDGVFYNFGWLAMGGLKVSLSENVALDLNGQYNFLRPIFDSFTCGAGLSFKIGGRP